MGISKRGLADVAIVAYCTKQNDLDKTSVVTLNLTFVFAASLRRTLNALEMYKKIGSIIFLLHSFRKKQ